MRHRLGKALAIATLTMALPWGNAVAQAMSLDDAEKLMADGKFDAAYEALNAREDELTGEQRYDLLLGIAALRSGRPSEASYALERVLIVNPDFLDARLYMAQAYFALRSDDLARAELESLQRAEPPQWARKVIVQLLEQIEERNNSTQIRFYVEGGVGHDTNINGATDATSIVAPGLIDATFNPTGTLNLTGNTASSDQYLSARTGAALSHKITEQLTFSGTASVGHKEFLTTDGQELTDYGATSAFSHTVGPDTVGFSFGLRRTELDHDPYQNLMSLDVSWRHDLSTSTQTSVFLQHARPRYIRNSDQGNDSNISTVGAGVVHRLTEDGRTTVSVNALGGFDEERNIRTDGNRQFIGAQAAIDHVWRPDTRLYATAFALRSDYSRRNTAFSIKRNDTSVNLRMGATWVPARDWTVTPEVSFINNESNAPLSDYDRLDLGLKVRWSF